jgi:hypothetical protein
MRGQGAWTNIKAMRLRLVFPLVLLLLALTGGAARAAEVAYIDGGQVWISTLDGAQKRSLSGPSPDEKTWTETAQADNGTVIGVRREGAKMGNFNATSLWGPDGSKVGDGSLTPQNGWTSYAYPVSLDLTPDGKIVVYGYSNTYGFGLEQKFEFGTYVEGSSAWYVEPFKTTAVESGMLIGSRMVGVQGDTAYLQKAVGQPPYSNEFDPWFRFPGEELQRVVGSGDGRVAAVEIGSYDKTTVAMIPFAALGAEPPKDGSDCTLPTQGDPDNVSISPDGTSMAWADDRGVVVAGTPVWFPDPNPSICNLSRPPVVISGTGKYPSLGESTAAIVPSGPPVSPPAPGPAGGSGGGAKKGGGGAGAGGGPAVSLPKTVKASALGAGVKLSVTAPGKGKVTAVGKVGRQVVAKGEARAKRAGKVQVTLKALRAYRAKLASLKGKNLKITVSAAGKTTTLTRKLG